MYFHLSFAMIQYKCGFLVKPHLAKGEMET